MATNVVKEKEEKKKGFIKDKENISKYAPMIGLGALIIVYTIIAPNFFSIDNFINIAKQVSVIGIMAVGITFVLIAGEIDLSIASIMPLSGMLCAALSVGAYGTNIVLPVPLCIIIGLAVGFLFGVISGLAISKLGIPSFMATLSIMYICDGLLLWFTKAIPLYDLPESLLVLGGGKVWGLPIIIFVFAGALIVGHVVLSQTVFGRNVYAVGGNVVAAKMSGVSVTKHKVIVMGISGLLSALAGVLMLGRLGSGQVTAGTGMMLPPIVAVILGGTSMFGGQGNLLRTIAGVFLMGCLVNGLNLMGVGADGQKLATGLVLFVAVSFNVWGTKNA